jgi:putative tricarboxylic transport membrane protein
MAVMRALFDRSEFLSGLFVLALGGICLLAVGNLDIGNAQEMGPGYVPRALAWFLVIAGAGMTLVGARTVFPRRPTFVLRPVLFIGAAVVVFGATVDRFGLVVAVIASTIVASFASPISRWRETPLVAIVLAVFAVIVFVKGLGLAIPIWPR